MNRKILFGLVLSVVILTMLVSSVGASATPPTVSPLLAMTAPGKLVSKLTPRLAALAQSSALRAASIQEQAFALSVAPNGAGSLQRDMNGRLLVEIRTTDFSASGLQALRDAGAVISNVSERYGIISAFADGRNLNAIANVAAVQNVQEALAPMTSRNMPPFAQRSPGRGAPSSTCPQGIVVSDGDAQLRANLARSNFSLDGTGVNVGVLSDSYNTWAAAPTHAADDVTSGDLPGTTNSCTGQSTPVNVIADNPASTDEGRGMLQIVHDLVPNATLRFATAYNTQNNFATNIRALQTAGANIIVDDVTYFAEPFFQDGIVTVAISDVVGAGALYFTSAANSNVQIGANDVGSNEAPAYRSTTCGLGVPAYAESCHNFNPSGGTQASMDITLANTGYVYLDLQWAQPWYGVTTDIDLYMTNSAGTLVAKSENLNPGPTGTQQPFEFLNYQNTTGSTQTYHVYIARYTAGGFTGTPRVKLIIFSSSGVTAVSPNVSSGGDIVGPSIMGHSASNYAFSVAAARYNDDNNPEYFSSRGPATHYYGPILSTTPASAIPPDLIQQPDFAATDGACTTFFGQVYGGCSYRFFGTSAAAPHAAAVSALLKQEANLKGVTLSRVTAKSHLTSSARAMSGGNINSVGAGLLDANAAVNKLSNTTEVKLSTFSASAPSFDLGAWLREILRLGR